METPLIKATSELDFPLKSPLQSLHLANGISNTTHTAPLKLSDIEMVALQSLTYTSLKDLLPAANSPVSSIMSPTYDRKDSWREIPIKDPLVKHAAWAYLRPMTTAPETDGPSCFSKLKDKCCGQLIRCFGGFFNDVALTAIKSLFAKGGSDNKNEDDDDKVDVMDRVSMNL